MYGGALYAGTSLSLSAGAGVFCLVVSFSLGFAGRALARSLSDEHARASHTHSRILAVTNQPDELFIVERCVFGLEREHAPGNRASGGGAIGIDRVNQLVVRDTTFTRSSAGIGGVLYMEGKVDRALFARTTFSHSVAEREGGAIWFNDADGRADDRAVLELRETRFVASEARNLVNGPTRGAVRGNDVYIYTWATLRSDSCVGSDGVTLDEEASVYTEHTEQVERFQCGCASNAGGVYEGELVDCTAVDVTHPPTRAPTGKTNPSIIGSGTAGSTSSADSDLKIVVIVVCTTGGAILIAAMALLYWRAKRAETRSPSCSSNTSCCKTPAARPLRSANAEDRARRTRGALRSCSAANSRA